METSHFIEEFRNPEAIRALSRKIHTLCDAFSQPVRLMEVCGGHTHSIMKYGLHQLLQGCVEFVHGPGCPVCVMPKERIDHAVTLSLREGVILATLGDMIRVPGSLGSLQQARAEGADVRFVYSPLDVIPLAHSHPDKQVIFFAIGFETTTPMTAALLAHSLKLPNLLLHINHITVPEAMEALLSGGEAQLDAFIGPSHVSVVTGASLFAPIVERYSKPVVVAGFEPVDLLEGVLMIVEQLREGRADLEIQYTRSVTLEGNRQAQRMVERSFTRREKFRWRGLGDIPLSALKLKEEYAHKDAEVLYGDLLPSEPIDDHKLCLCGKILKGIAKPTDCPVFGTACTPSKPMGSCMVSSEGACAAYYRYNRPFAVV